MIWSSLIRKIQGERTLNGQLLLTMLAEKIYQEDVELAQINTDGIMVYVDRSKLDKLREICDWWEDLTGLSLDFDYFDKLVQADVNNYLAKYDSKKMGYDKPVYKYKGRFEIEKAWYKDHSALVIPKAVSAYFFEGVSPEEFVRNHKDIFDFFIIGKVNKPWYLELRYINKKGEFEVKKLQKTNRYFISKRGGTLMKCNAEDGRELNTNVGYKVTVVNDFKNLPIEEYGINYEYYIAKVQQEIDLITHNNQMSLF